MAVGDGYKGQCGGGDRRLVVGNVNARNDRENNDIRSGSHVNDGSRRDDGDNAPNNVMTHDVDITDNIGDCAADSGGNNCAEAGRCSACSLLFAFGSLGSVNCLLALRFSLQSSGVCLVSPPKSEGLRALHCSGVSLVHCVWWPVASISGALVSTLTQEHWSPGFGRRIQRWWR